MQTQGCIRFQQHICLGVTRGGYQCPCAITAEFLQLRAATRSSLISIQSSSEVMSVLLCALGREWAVAIKTKGKKPGYINTHTHVHTGFVNSEFYSLSLQLVGLYIVTNYTETYGTKFAHSHLVLDQAESSTCLLKEMWPKAFWH